jgi:hypothetical protein
VARRSPFPELRTSLVLLGVLIAAMILVVTLLPAGSSTPGLDEVAALAARPADGPVPAAGPEAELGWRATGSRTDEVGDRAAVTVRYARGQATASLTVVDGDVLRGPAPAGSVVREVDGRTHVVTGAGASPRELGDLAAAVGGEVGP